jgi:hypothetical protein
MATANKLSLPPTAQNNAVSAGHLSDKRPAKLPAAENSNEFKISTPQKTVPEKELVAVRK